MRTGFVAHGGDILFQVCEESAVSCEELCDDEVQNDESGNVESGKESPHKPIGSVVVDCFEFPSQPVPSSALDKFFVISQKSDCSGACAFPQCCFGHGTEGFVASSWSSANEFAIHGVEMFNNGVLGLVDSPACIFDETGGLQLVVDDSDGVRACNVVDGHVVERFLERQLSDLLAVHEVIEAHSLLIKTRAVRVQPKVEPKSKCLPLSCVDLLHSCRDVEVVVTLGAVWKGRNIRGFYCPFVQVLANRIRCCGIFSGG